MKNTLNIPMAVLAENSNPDTTSNKYNFIPTKRVIDVFTSEGWRLVDAKALRPRTKDPRYVRHMISFEHEKYSALTDTEKYRVNVVNSHDGSSSFQFYSGLMRLVCSNGLIVGKSVPTYAVRHVGYTDERVATAIKETLEHAPKVSNMLTAMKNYTMTESERLAFYIKASRLIQSKDNNRFFNLKTFERPVRWQDDKNDLWTVFNRVQEYCLRGGIKYNALNSKGEAIYRITRPLTQINKQVKINRALWDLAMESLEKAGV